MLQITSNPKQTTLQASRTAIVGFTLAVASVLGALYRLLEPGPSSYTSKFVLLALALFAVAIGSEELADRTGSSDEERSIVAMLAQRIGFVQACLGGALLFATAL